MSQTVRDSALESRAARSRLSVRTKPYYRALDPGLHLGYRRNANGGSWLVRVYLGSEKYALTKLGTADDKADPDGAAILSFSQAQAAARVQHVAKVRAAAGLPTAGPYTVAAALKDYIAWLELERRTSRDAQWAGDAFINPKLGHILCERLTSKHIQDWLYALAKAPPRLRAKAGAKPRHSQVDGTNAEVRRRRQSSANRILTTLKAALNRAWRENRIDNDKAWRSVRPFANADASRARYLTPEQCARLVDAAEEGFRDLVRAALFTGCRYSELSRLVAADFNADVGTLAIHTSKSGKPRHVVLTRDGVTFFARLALRGANHPTLLTRADGSSWGKGWQIRPMTAACAAARIKPAAGFHVLRHTWASLTVMNGAPLLVVAKNMGHTTTRMVEKHYGHLAPSYMADAIRDAAPRFDISRDTEGVVTPLRRHKFAKG